jgi:hypothetical protein
MQWKAKKVASLKLALIKEKDFGFFLPGILRRLPVWLVAAITPTINMPLYFVPLDNTHTTFN